MVSLMRLNSIDASTWLTGHLMLCSMLDAQFSLLLMFQLKNQCSISRRVKMLNACARCRQRFANNWIKSGKCVSTYTSHKFHFLATHTHAAYKRWYSALAISTFNHSAKVDASIHLTMNQSTPLRWRSKFFISFLFQSRFKWIHLPLNLLNSSNSSKKYALKTHWGRLCTAIALCDASFRNCVTSASTLTRNLVCACVCFFAAFFRIQK